MEISVPWDVLRMINFKFVFVDEYGMFTAGTEGGAC